MQPVDDRIGNAAFSAAANNARIAARAEHVGDCARAGGDVKGAARDFEALFATMLIKEMRKALPEGFFGGESEGDIYGGWFDEQLGRKIAEDGALHLADTLEATLAKRLAPASAANEASVATAADAREVAP